MSFTIDMLNSIRANADAEYQARVPEATQNNISTIGRAFQDYSLVYNQFISALIHKIGLTIFRTKTFENKLKQFKQGAILTQQDIEEIWVDQFREAEGSYDANGGTENGGINPFKRRTYQEVQVMYHRQNRQDKYVISISKIDVIKAFRSEATLTKFLTAQFNSIYNGAEYDEFVHMKKLFEEAIAEGDFFDYEVPVIDGTTEKTLAFVRSVKKAVKDVEYPSTQFNPAGVKTLAKPEDLVLFIHKDVAVHMDVDLYSQIFGPEYAKMPVKVVEVDNFGADNTGTYALLCDKEWFQVWDTLNTLEELGNPEGLYRNFWLHIWQILSYSKFMTAIRFVGKASEPAEASEE